MKWATVQNQAGEQFVGIVVEDGKTIVHLKKLAELVNWPEKVPDNMLGVIRRGDSFVHSVQELIAEGKKRDIDKEVQYPISELRLLAPIPRPVKNIFCVGKNYREHVREMGSEKIPENLIVFTKPPTAVIGHGEKIPDHSELTAALDYEGELAIVIGKEGKNIPVEESFDYIFGYTIINDISARDLQSRHVQFFLGKSLDGSCPMGPWIVDKMELEDPQNLRIETRVNGDIRQNGNTAQMIFPIAEIIATISRGMTLEPGDIIATGTPAGVGKGFHPPKFLRTGDVIEISIENIGTLKNIVE